MIRKLLCLLGLHKWYNPCFTCNNGKCHKCKFEDLEISDSVCWYCGRLKK